MAVMHQSGCVSAGPARLNGDAQAAVDGAGRLAEHGQVGGPAAAADRAAAPMEQRQLDVVLLRHLGQALLGRPHAA